jgi:hypothetical protein
VLFGSSPAMDVIDGVYGYTISFEESLHASYDLQEFFGRYVL